MKFSKQRRKGRGAGATIAFGILLSAISFPVLALLTSLIISTTENPLGTIGICSLLTLLLSGALSGFFTTKFKGSGGVGASLIASLLFALILFSAGLIVNKGSLPLVTTVNLFAYIIVSLSFSALAAKKKRRLRR